MIRPSRRTRVGTAGRPSGRPCQPQPARRSGGLRARWAATAGAIAAALVAAIIPALVFSGHGSPHVVDAAGQQGSAGPTVTYPISMPTGYQLPTGLTPDAGGGVWFFAQGTVGGVARETLFHWSRASRSLVSYQVDFAKNPSLATGGDTPVLTDQSGRAWVGINHSLLIATPGSARLRTLTLPAVSVGAPGSGLPHFPTGPEFPAPGVIAPVESLAVGPGGRILVARMFATELQVVDPKSLTVSDIPLPAGTALAGLGQNDLGSGNGGDLVAAVLYSGKGVHELGQYANGRWTVTSAPCPAYAASVSEQTVVVSGPACVAAGAIGSGSAGTVALSSVRVRGLSSGPPMAIALDRSTVLVDLTRRGVVTERAAGQSSPSSLGKYVPDSLQGQASTTPVPVTIALAVPAAGGGIWFIPDAGTARVGLITP